MIRSRMTSKARTTVPVPVRRALGLETGDVLHWRIDDGRVILTCAASSAVSPFAIFHEWDSATDRAGYANL